MSSNKTRCLLAALAMLPLTAFAGEAQSVEKGRAVYQNTGLSGTAALISARVGKRFSSNWFSVHPPTTARMVVDHAQADRHDPG